MPPTTPMQQQWGEVVAALRAAYDGADEERFLAAVDVLTGIRERSVWITLRELDGRLRAALEQFQIDPRLLRLAGREMPDARARLDHVLRLTEQAAHRTLDLVERSTPLVARTAEGAAALAAQCRQSEPRRAAGPQARELLARLETFLTATQADGETVRANLAEVLMAQSYQDLSGQMIRHVIELVAQLEGELARLVQSTELEMTQSRRAPVVGDDLARGVGPAVPGVSAGTVDGQQDVDELLAMGMAMRGAS
jgi:chemotaxis protein CheZ